MGVSVAVGALRVQGGTTRAETFGLPSSLLLRPDSHLVLGQKLAPPVGMREVMQGEAEVVVRVFKQQRFGLLHQVATQSSLQLQHLLG